MNMRTLKIVEIIFFPHSDYTSLRTSAENVDKDRRYGQNFGPLVISQVDTPCQKQK